MTESDGPRAARTAEVPVNIDVARLVERVERDLLGGPRRYTRLEIIERIGMEPDEVRRLWRALGFASVDDDDVNFTDGDVAALTKVGELTAAAPVDDEMLHAMTRVLGQTFSRLAAWQGQIVLDLIMDSPELLDSPGEIVDLVEGLVDVIGDLQNYVWRRQLAAYLSRVASNASSDVGAEASMAVGFADLAQFTSFTRSATEAELRELLEAFESLSSEIVAEHHGRVVKTIGDEVLFVAHSAADAALIALDLVDAAELDPRLPPLRVGVAAGPVVERLGDVYGSTVNIASRLTSLCRPGTILIDRVMADSLADDARFALRSRRPESVRGFHHLRNWRLRRAEA
ncbi:adenylate/guanylate cyclase domain-containing protein [Jatrophihabitans sp.]|uniref:adenylate/guanylate cyclase domain-containing protein n=1 Tax=Jatrophihabitans sp. TaxID=1932789 RepID=UPI0030C71FEE|nr:Adenylate cyclase [Jatrophihabitans sp.]